MKIKVGDLVKCPADRGDAPYTGKIISVSPTVQTNWRGDKYVWVEVENSAGRKSIWPSHRLGLSIE